MSKAHDFRGENGSCTECGVLARVWDGVPNCPGKPKAPEPMRWVIPVETSATELPSAMERPVGSRCFVYATGQLNEVELDPEANPAQSHRYGTPRRWKTVGKE